MSERDRAPGGAATVLLVPGLGNSGPAHWQSRWEHVHPECRRVVQDDWERPTLQEWRRRLDEAVEAVPGPVVLVAHSLGCALIAHWPTGGRPGKVRGALLVAPADVDSPERTPPETRVFSPLPLDRLPFPAIVVASRDDPYVAFERARLFAERWGARFVDVGARGHINADSGLGDWEDGWLLAASLARPPHGHPIDALLAELAGPPSTNAGAAGGSTQGPDGALEAAGGTDLINLAAAMLNVIREHGTVLGPAPDERVEDVWTAAVCHRIALSLKQAFMSRDETSEVWLRFVRAWERAHLERTGYFHTHPRS